ncbi:MULTISPECIES: hypothetical protein [unclassified Clostridium]|uniref:hypothetical protein n=1 Tax=unclassified Clostridium TaxID=2614128 RepID=UPI0025B90A20|nr:MULTISPECIES: hypothetical protein [unclassified Clostridium]
MSRKLEVGMKVEGSRSIRGGIFVGKNNKITKIINERIYIKNDLGYVCSVHKSNFDKYFKIVENNLDIGDVATIKITIGRCYKEIKGVVIEKFDNGRICRIKTDDNMMHGGIFEVIFEREIPKEAFTTSLVFDKEYQCKINIRGRRTTVKLLHYNVETSIYCNKYDTYNREEGIDRAFKKALSKLLLKEVQE